MIYYNLLDVMLLSHYTTCIVLLTRSHIMLPLVMTEYKKPLMSI